MSQDRIVVVGGNHATIPTDAINIPLTVGKDGTGYDVKFFGDTSGSYMFWDADTNSLTLVNATLAYTGSFSESYGTSSIPLVLTAGSPLFSVYATNAGTSGSTNAEAVLFNTVMTGAGQVGGRVRVNMQTNILLGGWANAFKASVDCQTVGGSTGLLSVACLEMTLPAGNGRGAYTLLELEATAPSSGYNGGQYGSLIYINSSGTTRTAIDDSWVFMHMDSGFTAAADHLLSVNSQTLKVGLGALQATTRYLVLSQTQDGVGLGTSGSPMSVTYNGTKPLSVYTTCASTDGSTSYEPVYISTVMTGAGQVGGRVRVNMQTNVVLGGWANAFKASVDCSTNGASTGLLSVGCFEITMPASAGGSAYTCLEIEMTCPASGYAGGSAKPSFLYVNSSGTTRTVFDDYGVFLHIDSGLTAAADHILSANSQTLRVGIGVNFATTRYLFMSQTQDTLGLGTSGSPMTMTYNGTKALSIYTTCGSTDGSTSYEPVLINTVMTGAGQVGGRVKVNMSTNVVLGGWANAFKAQVECNTNGASTGLLSVGCMEMVLPASAGGSAYTCMELEMTCPSSGYTGASAKPSFLYVNSSGTTRTVFDDNGVFLHIDSGLTAEADHLLSATSQTLKVGIGVNFAMTRYLFMSQVQDTISIGLTGSKKSLITGTPEIVVWSTSALTSGTQDIVKIDFTQTAAVTSGYIKGIRCTMTSNVATPGSFNAIKGIIDYSTDGYAYGDCACLAAEMTLPNSVAPRGAYYGAEIQMSTGASSNFHSAAGPVAFLHMKMLGTPLEFEQYGYLFHLDGTGAATAGEIFDECTASAASHALKILIGTTPYWIMLQSNVDA
jgi:hypothetical protein